MNGKKKILAVLLAVVIVAAVIVGMVWHVEHYYIIDLQLYPKDAEVLDLREQEISVSHYEKIHEKLPDCEIRWNVPFQGSTYPQDTAALQVTALTEADVEALRYFTQLKTVDAAGCGDYPQLRLLQQTYPALDVRYSVTIGGVEYAQDAEVIRVDGITAEDIAALEYLPQLAQVQVESGKNSDQLTVLAETCQTRGIAFLVMLMDTGYEQTVTSLELERAGQEDLSMLHLLPSLTQVHLIDPQAEAQTLLQLVEAMPAVTFTWEKELLGTLYPGDVTQLDLTATISDKGAYAYEMAKKAPVQGDRDEITYLFAADSDYPLPDKTGDTQDLIAQVEEAAAYFPNLETVLLCGSILDNEAMAQFREAHRADYKVVWTVQCGGMVARTDTPYFMPTKYHVYYFQDHESGNLKYCEDMVCVDLGHMSIKHVEWAAYMPKLEYLVLAHTDVRSIEPLRNCKKLKFLELDWSADKDLSPLKDCTALEDLNLGNTNADYTPIGEMTWLKNLWMIGCSGAGVYKMTQALPDTNIVSAGAATVDSGWRDLANYYAMRDIMGMYYMSW